MRRMTSGIGILKLPKGGVASLACAIAAAGVCFSTTAAAQREPLPPECTPYQEAVQAGNLRLAQELRPACDRARAQKARDMRADRAAVATQAAAVQQQSLPPECVQYREALQARNALVARELARACQRARAQQGHEAQAKAPGVAPVPRSPGVRQVAAQPWEAELPQVAKVNETIQGTTPVETASRQASAFQVLADYVQLSSGQDGHWLISNQMLPGHAEFAAYIAAGRDADKQRTQLGGTTPGAPLTDEARQLLLSAFLSKPSVDKYLRLTRNRASQAVAARAQEAEAQKAAQAQTEAMARTQAWVDKDKALAQKAHVDMTVFGVPLGEPLSLPQCQGDQSSANVGALLTGLGTGLARTCVGDAAGNFALGITAIALSLGGVKTPSGSDAVAARLADSMCPDWVKAGGTCMLLLNVKDGIVVGASVQTNSATPSATIEAKLQVKYKVRVSKPDSTRCTNKYGASMQEENRSWSPPGLFVSFNPLGTDCIHGVVNVQTAGFHQEREGQVKEHETTQPTI